jgi:hypothetical protein
VTAPGCEGFLNGRRHRDDTDATQGIHCEFPSP